MIRTIFAEIKDPELFRWLGTSNKLFTSLEGENPGGSVKDHMVLGALQEFMDTGALREIDTVCEASAGSTAQSLAYYCNRLKIHCTLFVPDTISTEARRKMTELGAEVKAVSMDKAWEVYGEFCKRPGVLPFNQMGDPRKRIFYRGLGEKVSASVGAVDVVIGAVGTAHSLLGTSEGMSSRPWVMTAEPKSDQVSGIRNIETTRYGADDPCVPSLFDQRVLLDSAEFYSKKTILTSLGEIAFADSFRVVLGALKKSMRDRQPKKVFLLGASNRRIGGVGNC